MIISISGPMKSGKSTIISLLKDTLPKSTIYIDDPFETCWEFLVEKGYFSKFEEIFKDRELLFMYISRVCDRYRDIIKTYKESNDLVVLEGCYIDYLIYTQLHSWFHYPLSGFQEKTVIDLLSLKDCVSRIYMTTADDINYPVNKATLDRKSSKTAFLRNRKLETSYYDIFRSVDNVYTLSPDLFSCDKVIYDDLVAEGFLKD